LDNHSSGTSITECLSQLTRKLRAGSPLFPKKNAPLFVFLRAGFTVPRTVANPRGGLLHPLFTLTGLPLRKNLGGIFSAALSVASRHLGVTQRSALGSSDFPPVSALRRKPAIARLTRLYLKYSSIAMFASLSASVLSSLGIWRMVMSLNPVNKLLAFLLSGIISACLTFHKPFTWFATSSESV
jgi:hypothetical protein